MAGREALLDQALVALRRVAGGKGSKNLALIGLRGVGKTVLLDRIRTLALDEGLEPLVAEAPEDRSLPAVLAPALRTALLRLSNRERARVAAERALRGLKGFVLGMKWKYQDLEVGFDLDPEAGLADSGDLNADLQALMEVAGEAALAGGSALVLLVDELQYVPEQQLSALLVALHRTSQRQLPVLLIAAGLPQLRGRLGRAKSYAERLFSVQQLGPLSEAEAARAVRVPIESEDESITEGALRAVYAATEGYPYFLQEWGRCAWDAANASPIDEATVERAGPLAMSELDGSFFGVRMDRMAPSERRYLRAMAELGPGPHRSGEIARVLGKEVAQVAPTRAGLIEKGMVYSPEHGETAFTVPLFDGYLRRVMDGDWQNR